MSISGDFVKRVSYTGFSFLTVFVLLASTGCGEKKTLENDTEKSRIVLNGAGATFPSPVYANWSYNYSESSDKKVTVNYQGTGSGAGVNQLKEGTIDFAGTDAPLTGAEQKELGLVQFPMLAGGVVVIVNVPRIKNNELKLSQKLLADIFLGKIKKWNDPALLKENSGLTLPEIDITAVHRSDSSGTTFLFTDYLSKISSEWKEKVGSGKTVNWPVGIGGQKNPGVCNNVLKISGSIGYTEYTYAIESKLAMTVLQNASGKYITADENSFTEALKKTDWSKVNDFYLVLTNAEGDGSWPILGVTYILRKNDLDANKKEALNRYFNWCFDAGKNAALKMHYIPLPEEVVSNVRSKMGM